MSTIRIPGKVMLCGEYGVLHGGISVLLPIQRYVTVVRTDHPPKAGYPPGVAAAFRAHVPRLAEHEVFQGTPHLQFDLGEFAVQGPDGARVKLGLGSSSAEVVAALALRYHAAGLTWVQHWREIAGLGIQVHAELQDGLGSGADVACVAARQPIRYQREEGMYVIETIHAPPLWARPPLHLVWSGQPADTRHLVKQFEDWYTNGGARSRQTLRDVSQLGNECAEAWFTQSVADLIRRIDAHQAALEDCLAQAGVSYLLPVHQRLKAWAAKHGGRAKPSGAGGGDMILLVGELPVEQLEQLVIPLAYEQLWPAP